MKERWRYQEGRDLAAGWMTRGAFKAALICNRCSVPGVYINFESWISSMWDIFYAKKSPVRLESMTSRWQTQTWSFSPSISSGNPCNAWAQTPETSKCFTSLFVILLLCCKCTMITGKLMRDLQWRLSLGGYMYMVIMWSRCFFRDNEFS